MPGQINCFSKKRCFDHDITLQGPHGTKLSVARAREASTKIAIVMMKIVSDPYRTDRSKRPYKSGVKKIIGSVDKVENHCLSAASLVCDRPTP